LIPESRRKPIAESLLYKQIIRFLKEEKIREHFSIAFITTNEGIVSAASSQLLAGRSDENKSLIANSYKLKANKLPPKNFRSGRSWVSKKQIEHMAEKVVDYVRTHAEKYDKIIAYVRGSYLEAIRMANKVMSNEQCVIRKNGKLPITNYPLPITELFTDDELAQLKKKGIRWMKVGLRMPEAFTIFKKRIRDIIRESENRQLTLF
jgi:hypothetical protein